MKTDPENIIHHHTQKLLACPVCKRDLEVHQGLILCGVCGLVGSVRDGVVVLAEIAQRSFFDKTFKKMEKGKIRREDWEFYYRRQVDLIEKHLLPGMVVLDVGCGPSSPYKNRCDAFVIGLEASYESVKFNQNVALRVFGSATEVPLPDHSVDVIICLYSIHHVTGKDPSENRTGAQKCFREFGRILKPGGALFVFEDISAASFWYFQNFSWKPAKKILSGKLDMFFYSEKMLKTMGQAAGLGAPVETVYFPAGPFQIVTPVFSLPWLRIFRWMYPLKPALLKWVAP